MSTKSQNNGSDEMDEETPLLIGKDALLRVRTYSQGSGTISHHSEAATFDFRAPPPSHVTPEDVLQRMRYAFRNDGFDAENDFEAAQSMLNTLERSAFRDTVLDNLKETPMSMRERLGLRRLIYSKTHTRRRREQEIEESTTKSGNRNYTFVPFNLWEETIANLSAYFGSNVASYFKFLRILLLLNIAAGILMISFITVPQAIDGPQSFNSSISQFGWLSKSMLLFGSYSSDKIHNTYNQPLAYILTWMGVSLFYLIVIAVAMHIRYRQSKLSDNADDYEFALRTFSSWDHTIYSKEGVKDRRKALCMELKERIREERKARKPRLEKRLLRYLGRIISNTIVLGLLGGSGYLVYYVADEFKLPDSTPTELKTLFDKYQLSAVVSLLKLFIPLLFEFLVHLEGWPPRTALKITLFRTTLFYFASLVVFDMSLHNVASECSSDSCSDKGINTTEVVCCWENRVGEEVLKVVFIDLGLCIAVGLFFHVAKALFIKCRICCIQLELSEFGITSSVLDLIYGQGLIWLGLYFSPLIIVIGIIKLFVVFYTQLFVAKMAMVAPKKVFRASRSGNFYLFILLLTWFLCILPTAYTIAEVSPSADCGPFKKMCKAYDVISHSIGTWPDWLEEPVKYIGTAAVIIPVIILLLLVALYYRAKSSSYADLIKELRNQLKFERKVEKRKVYASALSTPFGTASKATGQKYEFDMEQTNFPIIKTNT
ncbi:transmembrane channel-like protein 3 [Mytilus trossulus]|uniref:transmembrane channel-like protein 3 n=1 Tax=Mytilus trossulus TaxID=6551 RepID=UPI003006936E